MVHTQNVKKSQLGGRGDFHWETVSCEFFQGRGTLYQPSIVQNTNQENIWKNLVSLSAYLDILHVMEVYTTFVF